MHRRPALRPDEITTYEGIPVTTPARTLFDLAPSLPARRLERALDQSVVLELFDLRSFDALLAAHAGERGAAKLRAALESHVAGTTMTKSELEERFLALCRAHGLPQPRCNAYVAGLEVDFVFDRHRVVVETDGYRYHGSRHAFERDRDRDAILTRAGYRPVRFSHRQVTRDADVVVRALGAALAAAAV